MPTLADHVRAVTWYEWANLWSTTFLKCEDAGRVMKSEFINIHDPCAWPGTPWRPTHV